MVWGTPRANLKDGLTTAFRRTPPCRPSLADARTAGRTACACVMSDPPRVRHLGLGAPRAASRVPRGGGSAGDQGRRLRSPAKCRWPSALLVPAARGDVLGQLLALVDCIGRRLRPGDRGCELLGALGPQVLEFLDLDELDACVRSIRVIGCVERVHGVERIDHDRAEGLRVILVAGYVIERLARA